MLHMVVLTHGADTCAAVNKASGDMIRYAVANLESTSEKLKCVVKGAWIDPPAHIFFFLIDAPNAHVINQAMQELKLMLWNTVDVHAVLTLEEAMPLAAK